MQQIGGASKPHGNGLCHRGFVMFHIRRDPHDGTTIGLHLGDDRHLSRRTLVVDFHGNHPIALLFQGFSDIRPFHHNLFFDGKNGISGRKMLLLCRTSRKYGADFG